MEVTPQNRSTVGVITLVAAAGMFFGLIGLEMSSMQDWVFVTTPKFIGTTLIHAGSVIGAYVAGQLIPTAQRLGGE